VTLHRYTPQPFIDVLWDTLDQTELLDRPNAKVRIQQQIYEGVRQAIRKAIEEDVLFDMDKMIVNGQGTSGGARNGQ
jgi:hypothetical protein